MNGTTRIPIGLLLRPILMKFKITSNLNLFDLVRYADVDCGPNQLKLKKWVVENSIDIEPLSQIATFPHEANDMSKEEVSRVVLEELKKHNNIEEIYTPEGVIGI